MKKIFITSSGTNIGKTLITCAMIKCMQKEFPSVHAIKPVISGFNPNIIPNDLFYICESLGLNYIRDRNRVNFVAFKKPLSPDMAARLEKRPEVNFRRLVSFINESSCEHLLVETAGGIMVPVNSRKTTLDLIASCADTLVVVTGSYLGSLSHTLTTLHVLKQAKKSPRLLIVTQSLERNDPLYIPLKETIKSLENFVSVPILAVEKLSGTEMTKINRLSRKLQPYMSNLTNNRN
jgi:dethiobiotin synthetase